jgi:hypothetical protein
MSVCRPFLIVMAISYVVPFDAGVIPSENLNPSAAPKREPQSHADLLHPRPAQTSDALAQPLLRNRDCVVEVYRAWTLHSILHIQSHFRRYVPDSRCDRSYGYCGKMANGAIASQNQNWPLFVGRRKQAQVNVSAVQSSGQAAAPSQGRYSSTRCG